ncbi:flavodoxin [Alistipes communis]|uniref:flavodoxin n=1 Tax=Alistipes communis TaxID=2585118 RepID=UPI0026DC7B1F|nr:flavodoxin [Alistipes communis]
MKKLIYLTMLLGIFLAFNACSSDDDESDKPQTEQPDEPGTDTDGPNSPDPNPDAEKTLIVYYSFTNNVHTIVNDLRTQIEADVVRVEPAEKGIDYAANNYAAGSALIQAIRNNPNSAISYPAIDPIEVDFEKYGTVIVAAPLWWSNMAAPLQSFLFSHGAEMAGKNIGLIVSSASSGISGVEADAKRLIPEGNFLAPSLWIRSSQTSNCHSMVAEWLEDIGYKNKTYDYE